MMNWFPIETAPKDGTPILGWIPDDGVWTSVYWYRNEEWPHLNEWKLYSTGFECWYDGCDPVYWMPMPEPPKE
jgi:hypothetical protein